MENATKVVDTSELEAYLIEMAQRMAGGGFAKIQAHPEARQVYQAYLRLLSLKQEMVEKYGEFECTLMREKQLLIRNPRFQGLSSIKSELYYPFIAINILPFAVFYA